MAGSPIITRTAMTDDDGTGTTGTIFNNAWKTSVYDQIDALIGSSATAWVAYTPTLAGITLGNGTKAFKWYRLGKTIHVEGRIVFGTTTTIAGATTFTLPVNCTNVSGGQQIGVATYMDFSAGPTYFAGPVLVGGVATGILYRYTGATAMPSVDTAVPFTWATSDEVNVTLTYQEP